jgi:ubiquitin C-terminal hydrolase
MWTLLKYLIIHFKRFQQTKEEVKKKDYKVTFPDALEMVDFVMRQSDDISTTDKLYSVSNHTGNIASGHYQSKCFFEEMKRWCVFADEHVQSFKQDLVHSPHAFILFYERI